MKWIFILSIILCLPACLMTGTNKYSYSQNVSLYSEPQKTFYIFIDKDFGFEEKKLITEAINEWNYVLNNSIKLEIFSFSFNMEPNILKEVNSNNIWFFLKVDKTCSFIPKSSKKERRIAAWADMLGGHKMYVVYDNIDGSIMFKEIIMHEIGHLLGADHINNPSLMYDLYTHYYYQCVDYKTAEEISSFQHIKIKSINYCSR